MNQELIQQSQALHPTFNSFRTRALIIAVVGIALTVFGYLDNADQPKEFFASYLLAFVYWISLTLGCLIVLMIHHLAGGRWGFAIRRLLEAGTRTLPLMFVLSIPLAFGIHELYEWSHEEVVAKDPVLQHKKAFLNPTFFVIRTALYFVIWGLIAFLLNRWSAQQDTTDQSHPTRRMQILSGPGTVVFVIVCTFAAVDWIMSLEPHWFSTIYAAIYIIGQILFTWAFMILVGASLSKRQPLDVLLTNERLRDLGTLMLGFVMLWAYTSFSQLLIIWAGNLPEEITWYYTRLRGGWENIGYLLVLLHFAFPFVLLVSSRIKARIPILCTLAAGLIIMRLVDLFWITAPALGKPELTINWMDIVIPVAFGGAWVFVFFGQLKKHSLVPLNDPRFNFEELAEEAKEDHHA